MKLFGKNVRCRPLIKEVPELELVYLVSFIVFEIVISIALKIYRPEIYLVLKGNGVSIVFITTVVLLQWVILRVIAGVSYFSNQSFWDKKECSNLKGKTLNNLNYLEVKRKLLIKRLSLFEEVKDEII